MSGNRKKYKITGGLAGEYPISEAEGAPLAPVIETVYAKNVFTAYLKILYMRLFYDWVEVSEE